MKIKKKWGGGRSGRGRGTVWGGQGRREQRSGLVKIQKKKKLGWGGRVGGGRVGGVGLGDQDGSERRIEVFLKIQKIIFIFFGGGGGFGSGGVRLWGQGRCVQRSEVVVKIKKNVGSGGRVGGSG